MTYNELVAFWDGLSNTANVLGIKNKQTVHAWKKRKRIPTRWQLKASVLSGGRLKADRLTQDLATDLVRFANGRRK